VLSRSKIALLLFMLPFAPAGAQPLLLDVPTTVLGVDVACTGVSLDAREEPRWAAYTLRVEFAGEGGRYLGGETVTLRQDGKVLFSGSCDGSWLLFRLPAGRYQVEAALDGQTATSSAIVPATGQACVILRYPTGG